MDLWIRSQNKKELIPNPKLGIDQCENRYYIVDRYDFERAFILGEYKSKERALEVLDEIDKYKQYWFVTITPYGKDIEPNVPDKRQVIESFKKLSNHIMF